MPGRRFDHLRAGEGTIATRPETALGVETAAVEGDDAGGFLATMLEGV